MAHKLNKKNGVWSFASHSENAWHGLGQIVDHAMTSEEAIRLANLDYEVKKAPLYAGIEPHEGIPLIYSPYEERVATYRTDNNDVLGIVGGRYEIVQNKDAFGFFDSIIDSKEAIFETAGVIGKGERIFVTAKLPEDMLVNGEAIKKYIILTNSHDGSSSVIAGFTNIRIVCNNTLQAALGNLQNKVSIPHITGAKNRIAEAHKLMGIASSYMTEVQEVFEAMSHKTITDEEMENFIASIITPKTSTAQTEEQKEELSKRTQNKIDATLEFALTHETQTTRATKNTVFGAYNAISGYYNYVTDFPTPEAKFKSLQFGQGSARIKEAFELCKIMTATNTEEAKAFAMYADFLYQNDPITLDFEF
jgi:phage/plasmid-like protein (TIGR03299 family)